MKLIIMCIKAIRARLMSFFLLIILLNGATNGIDYRSNHAKNSSQLLLQLLNENTQTTHHTTTSMITSSHTQKLLNCSKPLIDDYPPDMFTQRQRQMGAVIFHFFFAVYLFIAIMKVCDDYFMNSLEIIGEKLNLDQDVSGATFMAIGVFTSHSDPGLSAVVGSAIFNIMFVYGICGLLIFNTSKLSRWPFFRDSFFYCISIAFLLLLIRDNKVYWYESLILLILYGVYCLFMMNNDRLKEWAYTKFKTLEQETKNILPEGNTSLHNKAYGFFAKKSMSRSHSNKQEVFNEHSQEDMYAWGGTSENLHHEQFDSYQNSRVGSMGQQGNRKNQTLLNVDQLIAANTRQIEFSTSVFTVMMKRNLRLKLKTRFKMAVRRVIAEIKWVKQTTIWNSNTTDFSKYDCNPFNTINFELFLSDKPSLQEPMGHLKFLKWLLILPIRVVLHFSIPDVRIPKYRNWYILSFLISISWLAFLSDLIVWMITVIGFTFGIPDSLMAISFIAAGTSIPDAYTSYTVVREGMIDMGVSNIIGSNVFDLLIGLAFPWFVKAIFNHGYIIVNTNGLVYDSFLLFACVLVTVFVIHLRNWNLDRKSGYLFLSIYVAFLIFSAAIEMNVFSYVNPPMCP